MAKRIRTLSLISPTVRTMWFDGDTERRLADVADISWVPDDRPRTAHELIQLLGDSEALITHWSSPHLSPELFAQMPNLKLIAHGGGSVRFLVEKDDLADGPIVTTAGAQFAHAVAECTLAMTLMAQRHLHRFDALMHTPHNAWPRIDDFGTPYDLSTATVGIIGLGQISRLLIPMLRGVAGRITVYARTQQPARAAEMGFEYVDYDTLIQESDVVIVLAASTPETWGMLGEQQFAAMKADALLVNPGRSRLVDQDAMLRTLQAGNIRAALDVYDIEPLAADSPLRTLDNVVLLPHIAGASKQSRLLGGELVVTEIERYVRGEPQVFQVTEENYDHLA